MDGNVFLVTEVISSFMDYDGENNIQRLNHSEGSLSQILQENFTLILKPEYSQLFCPTWKISIYIYYHIAE